MGNCSQNVMYERRINLKKIKKLYCEKQICIHRKYLAYSLFGKTKLLTVLELLLISGYKLKEFFKNKHNIFYYSLLQLPAHWRKSGQLF